jgi:hypothetical protein
VLRHVLLYINIPKTQTTYYLHTVAVALTIIVRRIHNVLPKTLLHI